MEGYRDPTIPQFPQAENRFRVNKSNKRFPRAGWLKQRLLHVMHFLNHTIFSPRKYSSGLLVVRISEKTGVVIGILASTYTDKSFRMGFSAKPQFFGSLPWFSNSVDRQRVASAKRTMHGTFIPRWRACCELCGLLKVPNLQADLRSIFSRQ